MLGQAPACALGHTKLELDRINALRPVAAIEVDSVTASITAIFLGRCRPGTGVDLVALGSQPAEDAFLTLDGFQAVFPNKRPDSQPGAGTPEGGVWIFGLPVDVQ